MTLIIFRFRDSAFQNLPLPLEEGRDGGWLFVVSDLQPASPKIKWERNSQRAFALALRRLPRRSLFAINERVRIIVANKLITLRIKLNRAFQEHGNVGHVAGID